MQHRARRVSWVSSFAASVLLSIVLVAPVGAKGRAEQPSPTASGLQDAMAILEARGQAMAGVQGFRFTGRMEARSSGLRSPASSPDLAMKMSGEIALPDRAHLIISLPEEGTIEVVMITDSAWYRAAGERWESLGRSGMMMPTQFQPTEISQVASYLADLSVTDDGGSYRVSGALDMLQLLADQLASEFDLGEDLLAEVPSDADFGIHFQYVIDKRTMYVTGMELSFASQTSGLAALGGDALVMRMSLFDFDDPTIRIEAPTSTTPR